VGGIWERDVLYEEFKELGCSKICMLRSLFAVQVVAKEDAAASPSIHEMRGSLQDLFMYFIKVLLYQFVPTEMFEKASTVMLNNYITQNK
jgi:hypothetical protein